MMKNPQETISKLISHQNVCFLSSIDGEGYPVTRAMLMPRKIEGIKTFYFSTNTSSNKIAEYTKDPKACVYFVDRRFFRGVMLKGEVEVLTDEKHKEMLWQNGDEQYYPLGVTDPDYCVLRLTVKNGRYYSGYKTEDFTP